MELFKSIPPGKSNLALIAIKIVSKRFQRPHSLKDRKKKILLNRLSLHKEVLVHQLAHNLSWNPKTALIAQKKE